jgi:hypothetical protein
MSEIKVAAILDNRRLVLSAGSAKGIKKDDKYMIYASEGKKITDPDSGKVLGELEIAKMPVRIIQLDEKFAVAETYRYKEVNEGGTLNSFTTISNYLVAPKIRREYDTFEVERHTRKEIDETRSIIKIGDIARPLKDPENQKN